MTADKSTIDPSLGVGDEVTVKGTIAGLSKSLIGEKPRVAIYVDHGGGLTHLYVSTDSIVSHTPKPKVPKNGDTVRRVNFSGYRYQVLGVEDQWAWIRFEKQDPFTTRLEQLVVVEPKTKPEGESK